MFSLNYNAIRKTLKPKSKLLYMGLYEKTAMPFRYDLILFDKYSPEKFKMFFDAKIRMIPRDVPCL